MDELNTATNKSHYISNNYFKERQDENNQDSNDQQGRLGGEVSSELGFGNLESAREYIEGFNYSNEELDEVNDSEINQHEE